ncbi:hypothetical protein Fmac_008641 [Flemingia macrophylla]|uniref:AIPP2-like SPOC-like domain-containing protein n=1 Tax=Flemingia macrophylla TaxID=520843 RepID=A0ABD1MXZ9_9FABA
MPSVFRLESLPALNVLTGIFRDESPKLQDIALFFFPSEDTERSRKNLSSILKFINAKKSLMRSYIGGVELLRAGVIAAVNAGHFLWGIFRQNKIDEVVRREPDMEPVDMDIDMIGGMMWLGELIIWWAGYPTRSQMGISGEKGMPGRIDQIRSSKPRVYNKLDVPPG